MTLAKQLQNEGWQIAGTTRTAEKQNSLLDLGIEAHLFDEKHPLSEPERALNGTTHLLTSIAPAISGDIVLRRHLDDLIATTSISWAGYLGTTGVYGDRDGDWVDESDPPKPSLDRTKRRVAAEGHWLASGLPTHIFRLAGIYGPGRNALETVKSGKARRIIKPNQMFGRIHVEDIAATLIASMNRPNPGAIYNVADDEPAPPQDVVTFAADLLGVEAPPEVPFEQADISEAARSFYADNRRVSNERIRAELGVELRYPNYRDGLRAIIEKMAS